MEKEKFTVSGEHELVLHGNEQDTSLYPDRMSPTVSIHANMMHVTIDAYNSTYMLGNIDVMGVFIQIIEMSGTLVYFKCIGPLKQQILEL